ncbi:MULTISPECIES: hypothetical protein [unclassified Lysinibacillus]|uniref:hypothetical protein n=1 Tax=unclassified Lysinibacillus TaxID=2636778 RepID=UPI00088AAB8F|nr:MULTISPECIES: hypothetical protein [unclassified Lysinibacillus]SCZ12613.1 hypothetical protein SAMN02787078_04536 [Lysinibacillus sp. SG9]SDB57359.1 hypothetical protein SAMN02787079_04534 [Lysinibacillus sp. TC-37]SFT21250.1 hypothetical protein SAMN02787087_04529 [Lysinibacillus sp. SG55]
MFKISFKIFENDSVEEMELNGADGYLQFEIDNETYGIFIPEDIDEFSVSIYWWLYYFLKAVLILKTESYVLISDIEKPKIWIELVKEKNIVKISKVTADKPEGSGAIETKEMPNLIHQYWKDKQISYEDLKTEVVNKTKLYIEELRVLNNDVNKDILNLESLILEIEK